MTPTIEARARVAAEAAAARVAEGLRDVPGVRVTVSGGEVVVEGRGLARRVLGEPALRWPGEALSRDTGR